MIIAVFGSSGAGKTYLLNEALKSGFSLKKPAALTTRPRRQGIDEHLDRIFLDDDSFDSELNSDRLCLINHVYGYRYAYYKKDISDCDIIIETHSREYQELEELSDKLVSIYVKPNSLGTAYRQVISRHNGEINRMAEIEEENKILERFATQHLFDFVVVNDYTETGRDNFIAVVQNIMRENNFSYPEKFHKT